MSERATCVWLGAGNHRHNDRISHTSIRNGPALQKRCEIILASQMCNIFRLTIWSAAKFDNGSKSGALTKMSFFSDIARGNTERLAGRKGSANSPARLLPPDLGLLLEPHRPIYKNRAGRFVTIFRGLKKTTHNRVTDHENFAFLKI